MLSVLSLPARVEPITRQLDVVRGILWRLRGRQGRGAILGLFLTVVLISGSLAIIPRLLTRTSNQGVVAAVTNAVQSQPGISLSLEGSLPGTNQDPLSAVNGDGQKFEASLAPPIQRIVTGSSATIESQRFSLLNPFGPVKNSAFFQTYLTLRYQTGLDKPGLITLISGHLPQPGLTAVSPRIFQGKAGDLGKQPLIAFQVALDQTTAQALKVKVGDNVLLTPDTNDPLTAGTPAAYLDYHLVAQVSGIFQGVHPEDRYWHEDNSLLQPAVLDQGNSTLVYAYGLISPDAYNQLLPQTSPIQWSYTWRYEIDPSRVNAGNYRTVSSATRSLLLTHGAATSFTSDPSTVTLHSPLPGALDAFAAQRAFLVSVVTLVTIGVIAVAILLLVLVCLLLVEREASGTALLRGRGAAVRQLLAAQALQALVIAIPAAAIGYLIARLVVPVESLGLDLLLAVVTGVAAIVLAILAALPQARMPLGRFLSQQRDPGRDAVRTTPHRVRRIAIEAAVVVLAVAGIYLVRRRGLVQSRGGIDPYLALLPFLTGLAVGIIVLRLYPLPVRLLGRGVQRGRGIVAWVGLRRVARQPVSAQLPMLALLVAVGVAVFSLVVQHSLVVAQDTAAWQTVGAAYRIDAPGGGTALSKLNPQSIAGVRAAASAYFLASASVGNGGSSVSGASVLAIDPAAYQAVTKGTPAAVNFPPALLQPPAGGRPGSQTNPLAAIVSTSWPGGARNGQTLQVTLESVPFWIRVVSVVPTFPAVPVDAPFIVLSRADLQAANAAQGATLPVTRLYLRAGSGDVAARLRQAIQRQAPGAVLTSRADILSANSHQMLAGGVTTVFRYSVVLVALYAAAAGSVALLLAGAARKRDLSYLRTLGLSTRQALGITVIEQLPPVIIAGVAGAGLGIAIARLIGPALDLSAFAGRTGIAAGIVISWWQVAALAGGLCLAVLIVIIAFGLLTRRLDLASALRLGER